MNPALHLMFLPRDPDAPARELFAAADGSPLPRRPEAATPLLRVLVAPGEDCVLRRVAAGAASAAQARAAAWHALDGQLATARDSLDWVVADAATDGSRWVAGVAPATRQAWLDSAASRGFKPDRMLPDCLLLPAPAQPGHVVVFDGAGGMRWARDADLAFSAEAGLADRLLAGRGIETMAGPEGDAALPRGAAAPDLPDLLPRAAERDGHARVVPGRRLLALAATLLVSPLLVWAAQAVRHDVAAARLDAAADKALHEVAPTTSGPGRALARARAELARRQAPDRFGQLAAALLEVQSQSPGSRLLLLELQSDGVLLVRWQHGPEGMPANLEERLAERGIALAETGTDSGGTQPVSTFLLSDLP